MERIYRDGYIAECNDALAHLAGFEWASQVDRPPGARPGVAVEPHRPQCNPPCDPYEIPVHHGGNVADRRRRQTPVCTAKPVGHCRRWNTAAYLGKQS